MIRYCPYSIIFSYDFMIISSSLIFPSSTFVFTGRQTIQKNDAMIKLDLSQGESMYMKSGGVYVFNLDIPSKTGWGVL